MPMRRLARALLLALVLWNLAFLALSWWLAVDAERDHPPVGEFVLVDGLRVHVDDTGPPAARPAPGTEAPTLLLLHGASTSLLDFAPSLVPALAGRYRVISVDRPGHGDSEPTERWADPYAQARLARGVLDALAVERAVWIGHSWSGAVVLAALLDEGDRVAGGVLIAGVTHPWEGGSPGHVEFATTPLIGPLFAHQYIPPLGRLMLEPTVASAFAPESVPPGYAERTGLALSLRPDAYLSNARDRTRLSAHLDAQSRRYGEIERPLLSLVGTADTVVPPANHNARLAASLPALRTVTFEAAGHAFHHTRTARVAAEIGAFVDSLTR